MKKSMKITGWLAWLLIPALTLTACGDDSEDDIPGGSTTPSSVTLSAPSVSGITQTSATVTATATGTGIVNQGVCYGLTANPTISDSYMQSASPSISVTLSGLSASTTYHVRVTAYTSDKQRIYSDDVTFTTLPEEKKESDLASWKAPAYADDYRNLSTWAQRAQWNLANVHDPSVVLGDDGYYYMYCTDAGYGNPQAGHGHFHCRRSADLVNWQYIGATMNETPAWVMTKLNEIRKEMGLGNSTANTNDYGYWAPCVRKVRSGLYRMYYAIVVPGTIDGDGTWSERAFIGLMETADLASNNWQDKGFVITNYSDKELNFHVKADNWQGCYYKYNAIDPSLIITPEGEHWLVYGSWHSGFAAVQLNAETGKTIVDPLPNPWGAANEAAYGKRIFTRKAGDRWQGAEAPEVVWHDGYYYLFGNWYYASQQRFPTTAGGNAPNAVMLGGVRSIKWLANGWPVVMPERYAAVPQEPITADEIAGTWEHIDLGYKYGEMKVSGSMTFAADGTITDGPWKGGKWSFDATTNTLTANGVELKVQRECDWEANPRKHTIVYSGINGQKSYWGKKL